MIKFPTGVRVLFICETYTYAGTVDYGNQEYVELKDAVLVLDTGPLSKPHWNEAEYLGKWTLQTCKIESWGICEKKIKPDETNKHAPEIRNW